MMEGLSELLIEREEGRRVRLIGYDISGVGKGMGMGMGREEGF